MALTFAAYETTKTVTVNTYSDTRTEENEYFWLDLYKTYADAGSGDYAAFASGGIKDAAAETDYDYTVTSSAYKTSPIEEGGQITFTVTRSSSGTSSTVYLSTSGGDASNSGG